MKYSNPTMYGGVMFRSRLEADFAKWFDSMGLLWSFEPQGYKLTDELSYLPDFYLPAQKAWLESKGVMLPKDEAKIIQLAKDSNCDVFIGTRIRGGDLRIGVVDIYNNGNQAIYDGTVVAAKCNRCGGVWLMDEWGSWACRCCGHYDGNAGFDTIAVAKSRVGIDPDELLGEAYEARAASSYLSNRGGRSSCAV